MTRSNHLPSEIWPPFHQAYLRAGTTGAYGGTRFQITDPPMRRLQIFQPNSDQPPLPIAFYQPPTIEESLVMLLGTWYSLPTSLRRERRLFHWDSGTLTKLSLVSVPDAGSKGRHEVLTNRPWSTAPTKKWLALASGIVRLATWLSASPAFGLCACNARQVLSTSYFYHKSILAAAVAVSLDDRCRTTWWRP